MASQTYLITIIALGLILFGCLGQPAESIVDSATTPTTETTTEPSTKPVEVAKIDSIVGCWITTLTFIDGEEQFDFRSDGTFSKTSSSAVLLDSSGTWKRISNNSIETTYENGETVLVREETAEVLIHIEREYKKSECVSLAIFNLKLCDVLTLDDVNSVVSFTLTKSGENPNVDGPSCAYLSDKNTGALSFIQGEHGVTLGVLKGYYTLVGTEVKNIDGVGKGTFISESNDSSRVFRTINFQKSGVAFLIIGGDDSGEPLTENQLESLAKIAIKNLE